MITMLGWIVLCYGLAAVAVHLAHRLTKKLRGNRPQPWIHVVIVAQNDERHLEWIIRAYCWYAWFKGKRLEITVLDGGSTDETLPIVTRMMKRYEVICHVMTESTVKARELRVAQLQQAKEDEETQIILYLYRQDNWRKLPFLAGGTV
ncbi:glycosyltransferase [Paenibacillus sp. SC116]|uniref:glycosyltransferase n=1 Tax=Paenibacillus sp. SC116 TaxID=2968986 RepID=UPI00215B6ECB|nr:glycosyltransferase [Paenibacillus sp. SC116]MCR8844793.1 glycosyltransferase [Paenibacillus sp. SC116]